MVVKPYPRRVLFVFAWLVVGGEETEVRLLAKHLNPARYRIEVIPCFRKPDMPEQTHEQLEAMGVPVDRTPYRLSFEESIAYLVQKMPQYDIVVACQAVPDVYPALERLASPPPLIEHGGLISEARQGPKHLTTRYIGVCRSICEAAISRMPDRPCQVLEIPSMVDLSEFDPTQRDEVRRELRVSEENFTVGWVGRLDRKKRVEDFIQAAAILHRTHPQARFIIIGGSDAFMPEYAQELRLLTQIMGIQEVTQFLGDRKDVPRLLSGLDAFVWLSRGEGMPHVIAEAGAAGVPVIATQDNGAKEQITNNLNGLFVPYESPAEVAAALKRLILDSELCRYLGRNLRRKVVREYSTEVIIRRWETLFDEVIMEVQRGIRVEDNYQHPIQLNHLVA
jgi:polysaccharide biosynthesis protein PelF